MAITAITKRSPSKPCMISLKPRFSSPTRLPPGTRQSSKKSSAVSAAWVPSFRNRRPVRKPGVWVGTTISEMPPLPAPPVRQAVVTKSAMEPLEMKILEPLISHSPPSRSARVASAATSEPAPGSVTPSAPTSWPAAAGRT